jgi:hypothetical protein
MPDTTPDPVCRNSRRFMCPHVQNQFSKNWRMKQRDFTAWEKLLALKGHGFTRAANGKRTVGFSP